MKTDINQLPTKPGPYWFREKDGDEWAKIFEIRQWKGGMYACQIWPTNEVLEEGLMHHFVGQWSPIPMPDEGFEAWMLFHEISPIPDIYITEAEALSTMVAYNQHDPQKGYSVQPVAIYKREVE